MLKPAIEKALNDQIKKETYSAYLYLSMSAHFEAANLGGFAHWTRLQAEEELSHAMKFFGYLADRGGRVQLQAIEAPPSEFQSPRGVFEEVLAHERKISASIHELYKLAIKEDDPATQILLQWFITEQVEEEKNAEQIVEQAKMIEAHDTAMLFLDKQLAKRGKD
ncbi:MAG: ferritin [Vicinamibacteria bacterium]|jgi:ferritin|nr:ferritin [Vicinamibacteria bacterium]